MNNSVLNNAHQIIILKCLKENATNAMKIAKNANITLLYVFSANSAHTYMKKNVHKNVLLRISGIYKINVKYVMIIV